MSYVIIPLLRFLDLRRAVTARAKKEALNNPNIIVMDAGDEIVCDICNDLVEEDPVYVRADRLYCSKCREARV